MSLESYRPPFVYSDADVVFSTSDGVRFRLHKLVLSLSSDFFKDMFSLPQSQSLQTTKSSALPENAALDELPVVECSEPGNILENLFRLCYPIRDPTFSTIEEIRATTEAAMKYDMPEAIHLMRRELASQIPRFPLRIYAIACRLDFESEARAAAAAVFMQKAQDTYVEELEEITAGAYQRLLAYCNPQLSVRRLIYRASTNSVPLPRSTVPHDPTLAIAMKLAPHPFSEEDADISLVSSDGVDYRLSRLILRLSSPILEAMFNDSTVMLEPEVPCRLARRTLYLAESSSVLMTILTPCYPVDPPDVPNFDDAFAALTAAVKYGLQPAICFLTPLLPSLCNDPARLYFTGCDLGLRTLAAAAAKDAASQDLSNLAYPKMCFGRVSGGHLYRLLDYQRRSKAAMSSITTDRAWLQVLAERTTLSHGCRSSYGGESSYPCWFKGYMKALEEMTSLSRDSVTDVDLLCRTLRGAVRPGYRSTPCSTCTDFTGCTNLMKFAQLVAGRIEDAKAKTHLRWKP
ncbi:hypothetical protein C8Q80DRAFT_1241855 [Daedaleopsis nitida]|nr:hypothetical protein C8Q80DRAFT_1241855 [Daedaleopsis nitida]